MSHKIVVLDGIYANPGDLSWEPLNKYGDVSIYERSKATEVIVRSKDANILIINKIKLGASELDHLPNLELIIISATGMDNVDLEAANSRGIAVKNVTGYSTQSVVQHVFSLILTIYNKVLSHNQSVRGGDWNQTKGFSYLLDPIPELTEKTLTVVGFGQIGSEVAKIGHAFGMNVLVVSEHSKSLEKYDLVDLEKGFAQGDVVSLHWPLTEHKHKIVDKKLLNLMKTSSILINTARGGLINEKDLEEALRTNKIAFAALDVLSEESPTTNHPLFKLSNCIVTPHIAWASSRSRKVLLDKVFEHVAHF